MKLRYRFARWLFGVSPRDFVDTVEAHTRAVQALQRLYMDMNHRFEQLGLDVDSIGESTAEISTVFSGLDDLREVVEKMENLLEDLPGDVETLNEVVSDLARQLDDVARTVRDMELGG